MRIKYSVLRLKKCKYETPCVGYDTQVTVKACGPLIYFQQSNGVKQPSL